MQMKNPPHPGGFVFRQCTRPQSPQSHVWRGFRRYSMVARRPEFVIENPPTLKTHQV